MGSTLFKSCIGKSMKHQSYSRRNVKMCDKALQVNLTQSNETSAEVRDHRPPPLLPPIDPHYEIERPIISHECRCCNQYDIGPFTFIPASCEHQSHIFRI